MKPTLQSRLISEPLTVPKPIVEAEPSTLRLLVIAVSSAGLSALFGVSQASPVFGVAAAFAFATLLATLIAPERYVIYPIFVMVVNMLDHTTTTEVAMYGGAALRASLWQLTAFDLSPAMIVFAVLALRALVTLRSVRTSEIKWFTLYFFVVMPVISVAYGFLQHERPMRIFGDAKVPLFFTVGYLIFSSYYQRYPRQLLPSCKTLTAMVAGHFALDYGYLLTNRFVDDTSGFGNVSLDSGKGFVCILIFAAIGKILKGKHIGISLAIVLVSLHLLVSYQTRWLLVTMAAGAVLTVLFVGFRAVPGVLAIVVFLMVSVPIVAELSPTAWEVMKLRFRVSEGTVDLSVAGLESMDACRVASIYNAVGALIEKYAMLSGLGYGSWYGEGFYQFPQLTLHAFDAESISSGRFYRVHDFAFHFLFKFGLIGIGLYVGMFFRPVLSLWRIRHLVLTQEKISILLVVLTGVTPMIVSAMFWTGKGLLASALLVAVSRSLLLNVREGIGTWSR
jgi:hypothetical protein